MFKVNKAVPIPTTSRGDVPTRRKYPYSDLEIGDMFFIPNKTKNTLSTHTSTVGKVLGRRFITRLTYMIGDEENGWAPATKDTEDAVLGIGVWRAELLPPKEAAAAEPAQEAPAASETHESEDDEDDASDALNEVTEAPPKAVANGRRRR